MFNQSWWVMEGNARDWLSRVKIQLQSKYCHEQVKLFCSSENNFPNRFSNYSLAISVIRMLLHLSRSFNIGELILILFHFAHGVKPVVEFDWKFHRLCFVHKSRHAKLSWAFGKKASIEFEYLQWICHHHGWVFFSKIFLALRINRVQYFHFKLAPWSNRRLLLYWKFWCWWWNFRLQRKHSSLSS